MVGSSRQIRDILGLPSNYVCKKYVIDPLINQNKLSKNIFNFDNVKRYSNEDIEELKNILLKTIDYYNSEHLKYKDLMSTIFNGISSGVIREKVVKPLIKEGKLDKHVFHFGKSKVYDKDDINSLVKQSKKILKKERMNLDKLCKLLDVTLELFNSKIKPLIENSKEYSNLLTGSELTYSIYINGKLLKDRTRNELYNYIEINGIDLVKFNNRVHHAHDLIYSLHRLVKRYDKIEFFSTLEDNIIPDKIYYDLIINNKIYKHKSREEVRDILESFNRERLLLNNEKDLLTRNFVNLISRYNKIYNKKLNITI